MQTTYFLIVTFVFHCFALGADENVGRGEEDSTRTGLLAELPETVVTKTVDDRTEHSVRTDDVQHQSALTGNWNGMRDAIATMGFSVALGYKADMIANLRGGMSQGSMSFHNVDVVIGLNAERMFNWTGASFLVHAMNNSGGGFTEHVGDAQGVSNIDAPRMTKVYQVLYLQDIMQGRLSFAIGLYDLNSEFYVTRPASLFLNGSFGIGKDISQTGQAGPSIFPNPAAAFRVRIKPDETWSFQVAVLDAVPGKPNDVLSPAFALSVDEGVLLVSEVSYTLDGSEELQTGICRYSLGAWLYTAAFEEPFVADALGLSRRSTSNCGAYLMAEQCVFAEGESAGEGLSLFTRVGLTNGRINRFNYSVTIGAIYTGLLPNRNEDKLGFAVAQARNGKEYELQMAAIGTPVANAEFAFELTYRAHLTAWFALQSDLQYIYHPDTMLDIENATVLGTRIEIGL